jgi:hypothetical protein
MSDQGESTEALEALNRLQKLNALSSPERYLFAEVLFELGDSAGQNVSAEAIALMPDNPRPHWCENIRRKNENSNR